jgi:hypothetical protein
MPRPVRDSKMTHTDRAKADLLLSDIAAIDTAHALKAWGVRWSKECKESPHVAEIRKAYLDRMKELEGNK